ncbi:cytochrome P450 family protein [Shouchella clausii]|uniref:cytochrome P450 family protein n=1 Tax=Shouchella clausii TaxID=79880 RepID=UPI00211CA21F|nr:cytochrome P450 [Shouchella clausii]
MKIDFLNESFIRNPFPAYKQVREKDPVYRFLLPNGLYAWIVTRHEDAIAVFRDSRFITTPPHVMDITKPTGPIHKEIMSRNLLSVSPADHRRLRRLVQKAFTPRMVEKLRGRIVDIAHELLDKVQHKEEMNLIEDYAFPLPIIVICEMLGVPFKDQDQFRKWSDTIMESVNNPQLAEQSEQVMSAFVDYLRGLIAEKRNHLQDDLISDLIRVEEDGDALSEEEMYALVFVLIIAGHETTVNLIGNGMLALLEHSDQREKLQSQPELIHSAVEEMLRYDGPAEVSNIRWATEDVELQGKPVRKGDMLLISLASANRDKEAFEEPDMFDITRETNNHLAFGKGVHFCLGAPLARLEGEIAISTLLQRMPKLRLKKTGRDSLQWRPGMIIRGVKEIPLQF